MPRMPRTLSLTLLVVLLAAGCGMPGPHRSRSPSPDGDVITAREIEESGARDLWEVLERSSRYSRFNTGSRGSAFVSRRGETLSSVGGGTPLVLLDGTEATDLDQLRTLPAEVIESIRLLSGAHAPARYGIRAGAGAIVIETRRGSAGR